MPPGEMRAIDAGMQSIAVLLYLGLVVSVGVYILSNYAVRHLPVGRMSLLGCLTAPLRRDAVGAAARHAGEHSGYRRRRPRDIRRRPAIAGPAAISRRDLTGTDDLGEIAFGRTSLPDLRKAQRLLPRLPPHGSCYFARGPSAPCPDKSSVFITHEASMPNAFL